MRRLLIAVLLSCCWLPAQAQPPARVLIVGTYHFANPGRDLHNVQSVDVTTPERQAQVQAVTDALARFAPTVVAVEWPAAVVDERYAQYRRDALPPSANEVVQLGFRLAKGRGLAKVHGIDVDGDFPFGPVQAWAEQHGGKPRLDALMAGVQAMVQRTDDLQAQGSIGDALRYLNAPETLALAQTFYGEMMRFGGGDAQPGVALVSAWERRNLEICARLVQALAPGDRAVVFYGQGHAHLLQRCVRETPGLELVDALDYLPASGG